ncbi:unnamed protein product (macronuclear) [Paramecium tetraurelia]|uniref:Beta-mannosidase B n=1 Tax=Paramecium tetraurelia TaxID=5888 RepID=A0BV21_PARTE|nr:uncharacterized protein GSPATT00005634001 [Paramecium tetraurelia]CAK62388.1 unnamed protein product [Paramecium tetraurelia]|eukprot:XP_001429786.1 hypothetical protein (macronuclear) [Paramecium tetraurelia strain d4-2]
MLILLIITVTTGRLITNLNKGWNFRRSDNSTWYPANVPSTVHMDLMDNKLIDDPYFEDNLLSMYELELEEWEYKLEFTNKEFDYDINELVFEGIDTHADVYLNDIQILKANNQHRTWRVMIQNLQAQNTLRIYFHSAAKHDLMKQLQDSPLNLPYNYTYSRKAAYHYGWDWGPRIVTCGIWKDVYLDQYDYGRIVSMHAKALKIYEKSVVIEINIETFLINVGTYTIEVQFKGLDEITINNQYPLNVVNTKFLYNMTDIQLWWPIGQGEQKLYQLQAYLIKNESYVDYLKITTGFRVAQWIQEKDGDNTQTFKFRINGRDVYLKGANYIPPEMFLPRALKNSTIYERIFQDSIDAGYNGLRFWGGGQFEYDIFYELADKYGIIIWHDLMFACAMYPGTDDFIANVQAEIKDNVKRLRIHPSIVLWNGNNEVEIGWREWGWKAKRKESEIQMLQIWYNTLFLQAIPNVLNEIHPEIYYWPTSPSTSVNDVERLGFGDIHYWGVWAAKHQIENYTKFIGRFNSEYGMQAMIDVNNFKKAVPKQYDLNFDSPVFQIHERHVRGIPLIKEYLKNYTNYNSYSHSFLQLTYFSQIIQHLALQTAITSLRSAKPYNMGTFYWQINDVWPVISWASVDYYGCWKGGHYAAKKFHSDPALSAIQNEDQIQVYLINDNAINYSGNVTLELRQYNGFIVKSWEYKFQEISQNASKRLLNYYIQNYNQTYRSLYLQMNFYCDQKNCDYRGVYNFGRPKEWQLQKPDISYTLKGNTITFISKSLAKYVYIYSNSECINLSDNFFDLSPDVPYMVIMKESKKFSFFSYYDILVTAINNELLLLNEGMAALILYMIL